jgi:hypothetical protein
VRPLESVRIGLVIVALLATGCGGLSVGTELEASRAPLGCLAAADEFLTLTSTGELYALRVPTLERRLIARRPCGDAEVNNMAVSREGGVLIGYADGSFQVMDSTLDCSAPVPVLNQRFAAFELNAYGMNFVGDGRDGETLFLNLNYYDNPTTASNHLATFDLTSNEIRPVAPIAYAASAMELAGTPDGRLYGYQTGAFDMPGSILRIDTESGAVLEEIPTGPGLGLGSMAIAVTGDAAYVFGAKVTAANSHVWRVDLASQSVTDRGSMPFIVSGAGASTCAARAEAPP